MTHPGEPASVADELRKLVGLRDEGILSPADFEAQKARLLASSPPPSAPAPPGPWSGPLQAPVYPPANGPMPISPPTRRTRPWAWILLGLVVVGAILAFVVGRSGSGGGPSGPVGMGTPIPFSFSSGDTANITVTSIVAPATAIQYQLPPAAGDEYVGIQITVANTSTTNEVIDMGPITALSDSSGQSFTWSPTSLSDCPELGNAGLGTLAPDASASGCIAFAVPIGDTLSQVTIGSSGKTPGVWNVS